VTPRLGQPRQHRMLRRSFDEPQPCPVHRAPLIQHDLAGRADGRGSVEKVLDKTYGLLYNLEWRCIFSNALWWW
jgi:hypothetical protein